MCGGGLPVNALQRYRAGNDAGDTACSAFGWRVQQQRDHRDDNAGNAVGSGSERQPANPLGRPDYWWVQVLLQRRSAAVNFRQHFALTKRGHRSFALVTSLVFVIRVSCLREVSGTKIFWIS